MRKHWNEENLNRLARTAGIGPATAARLKEQRTSVGLEVLDKIADAFNVATWQLLVPGMDAESLPTLLPMSEKEREFYNRMINAAKDFKAR
jgi:transcriptional regulator with XRE-family HTH domain